MITRRQELEDEAKNPRELAYVNTRIQEVLQVLAAFKERRDEGGEILSAHTS